MESRFQSKIVKDLMRYLPQLVVPALLAFISVPIYTRFFNPAAYGNFNLVRITSYFLERCSSWIGSSLTRYYNEYDQNNQLSSMLTTLIKINLLLGGSVTLVILAVLAFVDMTSQLKLLCQIGTVMFAFYLISTTLKNVLRMQRRINTHSVFVLVTSVCSFVITLVLIMQFRFDIEAILLGNLVMLIVTLPFIWRIAVAGRFTIRGRIDVAILKRFATYGIPMTIGTLGVWILDFSDRYIIKALLSSYEVGVYSACYNVIWNSLFMIVNLFFMMEEPLAMKTYVKEGDGALRDFLRCETRLYLILILPLVVTMCCYSRTILSIMVAEEYQQGAAIVPYVAVSVFIIGLIYKYHLGILAKEKTRFLMYVVTASGLINIAINLVLIPHLGITGAGVATLASYLIYLAIILVGGARIFTWPFPFVSLCKVTVAAVAPIYGVWALLPPASDLVLQGLALTFSFLLYALLLYIFNEVRAQEFNIFRYFVKSSPKEAV